MLIEREDGVLLPVKVTPKAKETAIAGWENEVLKIKVTAAPEKGEANHAVIQLLSKTLRVPQKNIVLLKGEKTRHKLFIIKDTQKYELENRLKLQN